MALYLSSTTAIVTYHGYLVVRGSYRNQLMGSVWRELVKGR